MTDQQYTVVRNGTVLTPLDEIKDVQNLTLTAIVDGEVMQEGSSADMIYNIAELMEFISEDITLVPGDVISLAQARILMPGNIRRSLFFRICTLYLPASLTPPSMNLLRLWSSSLSKSNRCRIIKPASANTYATALPLPPQPTMPIFVV